MHAANRSTTSLDEALTEELLSAYASTSGSLANQAVYSQVRSIDAQEMAKRVPIGKDGALHSPGARKVRWHQQTLKAMGILEPDPESGRGYWRLTPSARNKLTPAPTKQVLLGFRTELGVALWSSSSSFFASLDEPITLCLTSPPYPLAQPRAYGNPSVHEYIDFVCELLEPIVANLVPGGSICLNISNDIFEPGSPARSLYRERLVIALCDRLGLSKMDELIWENPSKPPGPLQWASKSRQQLNVAWEPVYWFTNCPELCSADNRRVLQPHTQKHLDLIRRGGEARSAQYGDGAYRLKPGSYGRETAGRIPRNILRYSHSDAERAQARRWAIEHGLPTHGALMPKALAKFLIELLTAEGELVVDPCFGWGTSGLAAEETNRRWFGTELMGEHILGGSGRFERAPGFERFGALPR